MWRGLLRRCPACGHGALFGSFAKVADYCPHCHEELYHHRSDRMAPWSSAFLSAHVVVLPVLIAEWLWDLPFWQLVLAALPVWAGLSLLLLPSVKGAIVGMQWAARLNGFEYASMCRPDRPSM